MSVYRGRSNYWYSGGYWDRPIGPETEEDASIRPIPTPGYGWNVFKNWWYKARRSHLYRNPRNNNAQYVRRNQRWADLRWHASRRAAYYQRMSRYPPSAFWRPRASFARNDRDYFLRYRKNRADARKATATAAAAAANPHLLGEDGESIKDIYDRVIATAFPSDLDDDDDDSGYDRFKNAVEASGYSKPTQDELWYRFLAERKRAD